MDRRAAGQPAPAFGRPRGGVPWKIRTGAAPLRAFRRARSDGERLQARRRPSGGANGGWETAVRPASGSWNFQIRRMLGNIEGGVAPVARSIDPAWPHPTMSTEDP